MDADIFFFPRYATDLPILYFAAAGKVLDLASRFESSCRTVSTMMSLRLSGPSILESDESLQMFTNEIWRRRLNSHVSTISSRLREEADLFRVLNAARSARNTVAHELTLGFESWTRNVDSAKSFRTTLRECARTLGEGERVVAVLGTLLTHEELPTGRTLDELTEEYVSWVMDGIPDREP